MKRREKEGRGKKQCGRWSAISDRWPVPFAHYALPIIHYAIIVLFLNLLFSLSFPPSSFSVEVVDRIIATVNGEPITQSDIMWNLALTPEAPISRVDAQIIKQMLEQVIDQRLIHQEAEKLPTITVTDEEISQHIRQLIAGFPSEAAFRRRLETVGLTSEALRGIVLHRLEILKYIDFRFRSFVVITQQEIEEYYRTQLAPRIRGRGEVPPPLDEAMRSQIEMTLLEERINVEIEKWLADARSRADITVLAKF